MSMTKYKVDAVENHVGSGISIARALRISDYIVRVFPSSRAFLASFESDPPDLVILDLNMRDISGIDVLRTIRMSKGDKRDTRVLCVGKGVSTRQKCEVYNAGGDGFMESPFDIEEFTAMVRAQMRRVAKRKEIIHYGPFTLDKVEHEAKKNGMLVPLTNCEFLIFQTLMEGQGKTVSRDALYEAFGDPKKPFDPKSKALDMHIKSLRLKLGDGDTHIRNVYGDGYKLLD